MAYLVTQILNLNRTYTGGKLNPLPFDQKSLTDTKRTQRLTNRHVFPFKTNGRKRDFECPIHRIINNDISLLEIIRKMLILKPVHLEL